MRSPEEDVAEVIIEAVLRSLWSFRVELVFAGASGTLWFVASQRVGEVGAWLALSMLVLLVLAIGPLRSYFDTPGSDGNGFRRFDQRRSLRSRIGCRPSAG